MGGRGSSPVFVGRVEELERLEAACVATGNGSPAVVLLGGEAGVGKTRLITELTGRITAHGTRALSGGCVPIGEGALAYAPVVEALRTLVADLSAGAVRELIGPSWPEMAHLLPALGDPAAGGSPGQAKHATARLFELVLGLLGRLSELTPLLLVIEDLHWADQSTRDLLAFLARNLRRERILVVVTYRNDEPGQQRLGPYLAELDRGGPVQRIDLLKLDQVQTLAQLGGILGATPAADLVEKVFARSQGNPFFTEELLAVVQAGSGELPATVRDLLRGRVQTLPEPARQVLEAVAVAGRQVPHRLLATVAGLTDRQLYGALQAAVANQLLVTAPGEDGYDVRHALLREVIDADLLPGERARLHAGLAQALTEQPELAGVSPAVAAAEVAAHWDAAHEPDRALPARVAAGLAAERTHAFAEADSHYQRALELWERVPDPGRPAGLDRVELLARAAEVAAFTGAVERAVALLEEALDRVDPAAEPVRAAVLLASLGAHRRTTRDEPGALAAHEQAEGLLAGAPASTERARVLASHALTLNMISEIRQAIRYCEEAIAVARQVGARAEEARALDLLGACLDHEDPDRAIALHREARRIAEEVGDAETVVATYMNLSHVLAGVGRDHEALQDAQEGYRRARQLGLERAIGSYVAANLANGLLEAGRWEDCERLTGELLAGDSWCASELLACKGRLLTRRGDFAAAREQLDRSLQLSAPSDRGEAWLGLAELALWEGRHDDAATAVDEGLRWYAEVDPEGLASLGLIAWYTLLLRLEADRAEQAAARRAPEEVAEARRRAAAVVAELDRLARDQDAAYPNITGRLLVAQAELSRLEGNSNPERWQAATAAWDRLGRPFDAAYAGYRRAEAILAGGGSRTQAEAALRAAHQTTVTLGAEPLQREVELLAQRGRLRLKEPVDTSTSPEVPASPAASVGLTRREAEVLALVAEGRTNRQIGQALFITPKTASVHVSRILAKLGAAGRGEAAAIAHRLGLDKQ
jgi:DNA-binding CsgD family transcriptional regulator/tetratricopeptide (TPR) repeat protein